MSGRLDPASPWARQAFTPEDRADIEAILPDGVRVVVTCSADHRRYTLRAWQGKELVLTYGEMRDPVRAARLLADVLAVEALTVTTDTLGYVTSIESNRG
jgi:hypothetical protein